MLPSSGGYMVIIPDYFRTGNSDGFRAFAGDGNSIIQVDVSAATAAFAPPVAPVKGLSRREYQCRQTDARTAKRTAIAVRFEAEPSLNRGQSSSEPHSA